MERNPSELRGGCGLEKTGSPAYAELKVRIHPPPAAIRRTPTRTGTTSAAAHNRVPQVRRDVSWCASQDPAIYSHLPENLGESGSPHKSDTRCSGLWTRWQNRFATDSPLEETGFEPSVPPWKGRVSRRADRDRLSRPAWPTVKRTVGLPVRIRFPPAVSQANFKQVGTNLRPRSTATTSTGRFAPPGFEPQSSNCFSAPKRAVSWVGLEGRAKDAVFYCRAALST